MNTKYVFLIINHNILCGVFAPSEMDTNIHTHTIPLFCVFYIFFPIFVFILLSDPRIAVRYLNLHICYCFSGSKLQVYLDSQLTSEPKVLYIVPLPCQISD